MKVREPSTPGAINDRRQLHVLVAGLLEPWAKKWWLEHQPALVDCLARASDDAEIAAAELRRFRRCRCDRLVFLIEGGYLGGEALTTARQLLARLRQGESR